MIPLYVRGIKLEIILLPHHPDAPKFLWNSGEERGEVQVPTNINDATYFELRLIQEICRNKNINFRFMNDLKRTLLLINQSHGQSSQSKIDIQELRLNRGLVTFISQVSQMEGHLAKQLSDIDWVGRKNLGARVADIDLFFGGNTVLPISAKSGGPGTERNLGGDSLRELLGYDSTDILESMKSDTLNSLKSNFPNINFGSSWEQIRKNIKSSSHKEAMITLAATVGKRYQQLISAEILKAWQNATDNQKMSVVAYLSLQNDSRDKGLQIFVAEDNGAYFKNVLDISKVSASDLLLVSHQNSSNGTLELLIKKNRYWRLNVNFTNGLGLSPIAVRVFLI